MTQAQVEAALAQFEGLVIATARQIHADGAEVEEDDIRQLLRIKVWHAVQKFSEQRAAAAPHLGRRRDRYGRTPLQRYVFMCITNLRKDIAKRPRRYNYSLDALREERSGVDRPSSFDGKYLSVDADAVYGDVETVPLPQSLTAIERQIIDLRLEGIVFLQIDRTLGISRTERQTHMTSVRDKLIEFSPPPRSGPLPPLPGARSTRRRTRRVGQA